MSSHQFIKGTFWACIGLLFGRLVSLIIRMIVTRLGVTETGIFYLALYILKVGIVISLFGFVGFILRDVAEAFTKKKPALIKRIMNYSLSIVLPFSIAVAIILSLLAPYISTWFHEPSLRSTIYIIAATIPFLVCLRIAVNFFMATMNIKTYIFFEHFGRDSFRLVAAVIAFILLGTVNAILFGYLISAIILAVSALFFVKLNIRIKKRTKVKFNWKESFKFTTPLFGTSIASSSLEWIDSFMIGVLLSVADVGLYDTAFSMAWLLLLIPSATMKFFLQKIIGVYKRKKTLEAYYKKVASWNIALNGLIAGVFILFGKPLLHILFGPKFAPGYIFLIILSVGFWIGHSLSPARFLLYLNKRGNQILKIMLIAVIFNISANYVFIILYGSIGAAFATSISIIILSAGYIIAAYRDLKVLPFSKMMITPVIGMIYIIIGWYFIKDLPFVYYVTGALILLMVYAGIHVSSKEWRKDLQRIISSIIK